MAGAADGRPGLGPLAHVVLVPGQFAVPGQQRRWRARGTDAPLDRLRLDPLILRHCASPGPVDWNCCPGSAAGPGQGHVSIIDPVTGFGMLYPRKPGYGSIKATLRTQAAVI